MSSFVTKHGEMISRELFGKISQRYHTITKAVNREFWNSESDTLHSLYVGSYGRGTSINCSDIDMLVELPENEYRRYDVLKGNGQSRLLQALKYSILNSYPRSNVHADGQVVVVDFSDGIKFEVLPSFRNTWNNTFLYPDSHMGGRWKSTNPKAEQEAMRQKNRMSNGLLFDTCKHIRRVRNEYFSSYKLSGIVIDSFVYEAMGNWKWVDTGTSSNSWGDYENVLRDFYIQRSYNGIYLFSLYAPGSQQKVDLETSMVGLKKVLDFMCR